MLEVNLIKPHETILEEVAVLEPGEGEATDSGIK